MDKVDLIRALCEERDMTVNALEKTLGFPTGTVVKMKTSKPNADRLFEISQFFKVPMEIFFEADDEKQNAMMYEALHKEYSSNTQEVFKVSQPVFEVAAGQGRINSDYSDEYKEEEEMVDTDEYTWCKVCGESMSPLLQDGDYVKIHLQTQTSPHDLTAIKIDGESVTIKFVEVVENGVWLRAENKEVFEDKFYSVQEVLSLPITIIGRVVMSQRNF